MKSFFYSTSTPYRWSSGPIVTTFDPDNGYESIHSLERAKELAESRDTGYIGENTVVASYGVIYDLKEESFD